MPVAFELVVIVGDSRFNLDVKISGFVFFLFISFVFSASKTFFYWASHEVVIKFTFL